MTLTPAVKNCLLELLRFRSKYGISPTLEEIGAALGRGKNSTRSNVQKLLTLGLVTQEPYLPRSIVPNPDLCWSKRGEIYKVIRVYED